MTSVYAPRVFYYVVFCSLKIIDTTRPGKGWVTWWMMGVQQLKDVRAHCYCASLVRTLFIGHALPRHFQARAPIRKLNKT